MRCCRTQWQAWFGRACAWLLIAASAACDRSPSAPGTYPAAFDAFWREFDRSYSYFEYKQVDWDSLRTVFAPAVSGVTSWDALVTLLTGMVAPLRDVHIWFTGPQGQNVATYEPPHARNWDRDVWITYIANANWRQGQTNWGWGSFGDVGYLTVGAWNTSQVKIEDVDAALDQLRDRRAIIIDVRPNGGGSDALAYQVAGRFTTETVIAEYVQFRNGAGHGDLTTLTPKSLQPRGPWQYTKPVVVLVGRGCFSSNESFISAMRELPHVTIVGDTTGGSSGNPGFFDLGGGWRYGVPRWIAYTADHRIIEWNGIPPDVVVPWSPDDFTAGRDPVLDFALGFVNAEETR
jgi:hypothetical protein